MRTMKTLRATVIGAVLLAGCGQLQGPRVTCDGVPSAACQAAHAEAVAHGLFLTDGEQVLGAVVRPTRFRLCPGLEDLLYDVSFDVEGQGVPLVVSVGTTATGDLAVCTY